jgi:hypothetical protein
MRKSMTERAVELLKAAGMKGIAQDDLEKAIGFKGGNAAWSALSTRLSAVGAFPRQVEGTYTYRWFLKKPKT